MADHYTQFSEIIDDLTKEEAAWVAAVAAAGKRGTREELEALGIDPDKTEIDEEIEFPDFQSVVQHKPWNGGGMRWWIADDGGHGNLEDVATIVSAFIEKFRPAMIFSLTWAGTCSRPRFGEFGGGYVVVAKEEVVWGSVWDSAKKVAAALGENRRTE